MTIYLLRHGIAENARPGTGDEARELTTEGRKKLKEVLRLARGAGVKPARILTSPLMRAVQSAEAAAEVLGCEGRQIETAALQPGEEPAAVWREIRAHGDAESLLLAGHEPQFSSLTAYLLDAPSLVVDFKKGAMVAIEMERLGPKPLGVLRWMITPKVAGGGAG